MELKEFIKETIVHIIDGVKASQEYAMQQKATVVPDLIRSANRDKPYTQMGSIALHVDYVDFEVVLTATEGKENNKSIGVVFSVIGAGAKQKSEVEHVAVTSIKFSIPISYPKQI